MSMMKERWMEIAFCGGCKVRFQFPIQAPDESMAARIEEVLKVPSVSISAEGGARCMQKAARRILSSADDKDVKQSQQTESKNSSSK